MRISIIYLSICAAWAHGGPRFKVSQPRRMCRIGALAAPTPRRFNGHRALRWCMWGCQQHTPAAPLGPVGWLQSLCPRKRPPLKSQRAQLRGLGDVHTSTPQKQTNPSLNSDFSMRAIMHSCYYECVHVSHLRGAHVYYSNSTLKKRFPYPIYMTIVYPIAKRCGIQ